MTTISLTVVMLCVCTERACVCNKELVCKAVRLAFSCQTSDISLPFILTPWLLQMKKSRLADVEDLIRLEGPLTEDAVLKTLQSRFYNRKYQVIKMPSFYVDICVSNYLCKLSWKSWPDATCTPLQNYTISIISLDLAK